MSKDLEAIIDDAWEGRDALNASTKGAVRDAVEEALTLLDSGRARVAEKFKDEWIIHQWLKKAVLLSFRLNDMGLITGAPGDAPWWDKAAAARPSPTARDILKRDKRVAGLLKPLTKTQ